VYLLLLTAGALLVHGYHPYIEDAEIYLPGVEQLLDPRLFPVGKEFFRSHSHMTLFPNLVAGFLRISHIPFEMGLFLLHVTSIFLLLFACWQLNCLLFPNSRARWIGVCLIASLLTLPVSGTALYIMDQYLNPRNLGAFAGVLAVVSVIKGKYLQVFLWLIAAATVHPLMWVFPASFCAVWFVLGKLETKFGQVLAEKAAAIPACLGLIVPFVQGGTAPYHEAAKLHANHYIQHWTWYEWLGVVAPIFLFWCFGKIARKQQWFTLARTTRAFSIYGVVYVSLALALDLPGRFERLARVQPMRSLHLEYLFLFLCIGGLLGEFVLKRRTWLVMPLFVPLCLGMFAAQRQLFPRSAHIEWPGSAPKNPWARAFVWVRENTPIDAVFVLNPEYMHVDGEDEIGFRCLAQRSRLADAIKDNGVVSMFPQLAEEWWRQVQSQSPWKNLRAEDFLQLRQTLGVGWVVIEHEPLPGMDCKYQNEVVKVCRL
jgi:hypothetical protein